MPEAFFGPVSDLVGWVLTYLLHSSALIAAAWLVTRAVRLRPATRDALWKTALMGGVVTATAAVMSGWANADRIRLHEQIDAGAAGPIEAGAGHGSAAAAGPAAEGSVEASFFGVASDAGRRWISDGPVAVRREIRVRVLEPSEACRQALEAPQPLEAGWSAGVDANCAYNAGPSSRAAVLGGLFLWLLGAVVGVARWVGRWRALRPVVRDLSAADERSRRLLASLLGGRRSRMAPAPRLRASELVGAPCVLPGAIIVLPRRCELELTDAELRAVLAHEWAHVARRDVLWSGILRIVGAILWLQPLNRWAQEQLFVAMEESCDDWALRRTGERLGLARSISLVAEWSMAWSVAGPGLSIGGATRSGAADRVERILSGRRRLGEPVWLRSALIGLLLAPMYWMPRVPPPLSILRQAIFVEERDVVIVGPQRAVGDIGASDLLVGVDGGIHRSVTRLRRD